MKPQVELTKFIPSSGISEIDSKELVDAICKEKEANFAIASNIVNFDEHDDDEFVDIVNLNAAGTGNVTSFTNLAKIGKFFIIKNTGAGAKTITAGNNIKIVGGAATAVLATNEYARCFNNGSYVHLETICKWA